MKITSIDEIFELEFPKTDLLNGDKWKSELIDEIFDPNKIFIFNLTEEESFAIKKRFGVYDDGKIPSYETVVNALNEKFDKKWNVQYFLIIKKRIIKKITNHIIVKEHGKSTLIKNLPISDKAKRALERYCGLTTLDDFMKYSKDRLKKILKGQKETYHEIIEYANFLSHSSLNDEHNSNSIDVSSTIINLKLNERIICALHRQRIYTLKDLISYSVEEIQMMPRIGEDSLEKIKKCVNSVGLSFRDDRGKDSGKVEEYDVEIANGIKRMRIEQLTKLRNALLNVIAKENEEYTKIKK